MANTLVPPRPGPIQVYDEGAIIAWGGVQKFPRGYTFNVYWEAGEFSTPPVGALANVFETGLPSTMSSIRSQNGVNTIPINTDIYVAVTSVAPDGSESAQSPVLFLSMTNAEHNPPVAVARDESGQPKTLLVDESGNLVTDGAGAGATCTLTLQQQTDVSVTTTAADILSAPQIPSPLTARKMIIIQNDSGQDVFLGTATVQNHKLVTGGSRVLTADEIAVGMWAKLASGGPVTVNVWEYA